MDEQLDPIAQHPNGCSCERCADLEVCPCCEQQKLDADWCWACQRLIFAPWLLPLTRTTSERAD
jgi:hypothetical protein